MIEKLLVNYLLMIGLFLQGFSLKAQIESNQIDSLVSDAMTQFHVPGVAVGVVKEGKIIYAKGFGLRNIDDKNSFVNEHTQFAIASNTKAFTAAALAILVDEGKITWQTKVRSIIPEFTMYNSYVSDNFTIADLLTHRSGLGLGAGDLMLFPKGGDFTIHDILVNFQYFKPVSPFRTKFDYDNLLYIVAGEVVARVSGMSWREFVKKNILVPLRMDDTYCYYSLISDKKNVAEPHVVKNGVPHAVAPTQFDYNKINGAAASIYSGVYDLSKWMIVQMDGGKYGDSLKNTLFTGKSHQAMWSLHTVTKSRKSPRYNTHFSGYGYGWFLKDVQGKMEVSHTGGLTGMLSKVVMIPDINLGVVVLTNASNDGAGIFASVTQTIVDSYLGLNDNHLVTKYAAYFNRKQSKGDSVTKQVWKTVEEHKKLTIDKSRYTGIYKDSWLGKIEVYQKEGDLWFRSFRISGLTGKMYYYNANTFAIKWIDRDMEADAFALFCLDEEGEAKSIKMKGISPNIDFSYDFQDLNFKRLNHE